ncbi:MAG TPA: Hsp20 family protein [Sphingomicrobium sp.]|nr:Hsp20 family protein [Sphingomicrobium sp.]
MRTHIDLTPFRRSTVGFDRLFDLLESGPSFLGGETYPPFDLTSDGEDHYRITLAVAGFKPDEVDVTAQQNLLIVTGRKAEQNDADYIHRGIAARSFERRFVLGDYVQVTNADMKDGLLSIELMREIPEAMKPRKIAIGRGQSQAQLTDRAETPANQNQADQANAA